MQKVFFTSDLHFGHANVIRFDGRPFETVEEMKINAPLDHETQNLIRSKQDYANRLSEIIPAVIDANYKALTPTYTLISGLKNDYTLLTEDEKEEVKSLLREERFFGTPIADIINPRREVALLKISLALTTKYKNIADIDLDIENILESFYDAKLGSTFNTYELERQIESLSYVKYARVNHVVNERKVNTNYQVGYVLYYEDTNQYYIASNILGTSGTSVPTWNVPLTATEVDTGLETLDGSVVWRAYKELPNMGWSTDYSERKNNEPYGIGDYVHSNAAPDFMFKCVDILRSSGLTEPDITYAELGDFVADGGIVWVVCQRNDSAPIWSSFTTYGIKKATYNQGNIVNVTNNSEYSLECIGYTGTVGANENPDFELFEYPVVSYTVGSYETNGTLFVAGSKVAFFRPGDSITVTSPQIPYTFVVENSELVTTEDGEVNTKITVNKPLDEYVDYKTIQTVQRGTRDYQVLWSLVEDPTNITYPWNGYVVFDHVLEVIE